MPDTKISELPAASALTGAENFPAVQSATTKKVPASHLRDYVRKEAVTALSIVSGVVTIDCSLGRNFTLALTANVTSIVLTNLAGAGLATEIEIEFKQDGTGGKTVAMPAAFKALGGSDTAVASAANAVTVLSAKTFDNGTAWRYAMQESA